MKVDIEKMMQKPTIYGQSIWLGTVDKITHEIIQEMHLEVPLEVALVKEEDKYGYCKLETQDLQVFVAIAEVMQTVSFTNIAEIQQNDKVFLIDYALTTESISKNTQRIDQS